MMSMWLSALIWFLLLALLGWLAFPIAFRLLPGLPDRGYSLARALGLLLWGLIYWLLGNYGFLGNDVPSLLGALLILGGLSAWALAGGAAPELRHWLRAQRGMVIWMEVLLLAAVAFMVFVRASHPEALNTEKPMELAFINAVMRSPSMPPHDPWLSGYSISYYHFGYVMISMLAMLSGASGAVAFNLGVSTAFALAALGAYGLCYNLLSAYRPEARRGNLAWAILAPIFVLLVGNFGGLMELLHARHIFWNIDPAGGASSGFWSWLNIREWVNPPTDAPRWTPRLYGSGSWWWWRSSRVINDINFLGGEQELIDEFPAFSYVLGDLHPHVLSMPFVFLAMGLAFNIFRSDWRRSANIPRLGVPLGLGTFALAIAVLGGLAFLNIWDFPIYVVLFAAALALSRAAALGWDWERFREFLSTGMLIGLGGALLYLPFYLGFKSQAAGVLPNLLNPTRGAHLWVMFGTLFIPIFAYLLFLWRQRGNALKLRKALLLSAGVIFGLWLISLAGSWLAAQFFPGGWLGGALLALGAPDVPSLLAESVRRRLAGASGWLSLLILLNLVIGLLWPEGRPKTVRKESGSAVQYFLLLLALMAGLLVLAPEFFFLRDQFATRMNTVFKFYFQAWQMFAVVAAFGISVLIRELRGLGRVLALALAVFAIGSGLLFSVYGFTDVTRRPDGQALSLDATRYLSPDEAAAVAWLREQPLAALAEAVGGQYSAYARYATTSGQPGVLGWPGHEGQWRGDSVDFWPRRDDIERLYSGGNWQDAKAILDRYEVRYLVVGALERNAYPVNEAKFQSNLEIGFQNASVTIYLVP
jgi:YYY domain-containing protein